MYKSFMERVINRYTKLILPAAGMTMVSNITMSMMAPPPKIESVSFTTMLISKSMMYGICWPIIPFVLAVSPTTLIMVNHDMNVGSISTYEQQ